MRSENFKPLFTIRGEERERERVDQHSEAVGYVVCLRVSVENKIPISEYRSCFEATSGSPFQLFSDLLVKPLFKPRLALVQSDYGESICIFLCISCLWLSKICDLEFIFAVPFG